MATEWEWQLLYGDQTPARGSAPTDVLVTFQMVPVLPCAKKEERQRASPTRRAEGGQATPNERGAQIGDCHS